MKFRIIAISMVLLLFVTAMLPGMSYCLNSSITSYNNSITIEDDPSESPLFGLYKDGSCDSKWGSSAFSNGIVQVKKVTSGSAGTDKDKITVAQTVEMTGNIPVYIWIPESVNTVTIGVSYASSSSLLSSGSTITFKIGDRAGAPITLSPSVNSASITIPGGQAYRVSAELYVPVTGQNEVLDHGSDPVVDMTFSYPGIDRPVDNLGNVINLKYDISGITVESDNHVVVGPVTDSGLSVGNNNVFRIADSSGSFTGSTGKAEAVISASESLAFYVAVVLDINSQNSAIEVTIKEGNTTLYQKELVYKGSGPYEYYIGLEKKENPSVIEDTSIVELNPFSGKTLSIIVKEKKSGNAESNFYIVAVTNKTGGPI